VQYILTIPSLYKNAHVRTVQIYFCCINYVANVLYISNIV